MRLKVFLLFLAFQGFVLGVYQGVTVFWPGFNNKVLAQTDDFILKPSAFVRQLPAQVAPLPATPALHLSAQNENNAVISVPVEARAAIDRVVHLLPSDHLGSLKSVVLRYDSDAPRGLGGARTILLKTKGVSSEEMISVLIHEIGHTVDLGYLNPDFLDQKSEFKDGETPIYAGDASLDFYRISWSNEHQLRTDASNFDFVSGYAMTDPFEDFAESYIFYVLHNSDFRFLASTNTALLKKYTFLKNVVFKGQAFNTGSANEVSVFRRVWDVTLLPYDLGTLVN